MTAAQGFAALAARLAFMPALALSGCVSLSQDGGMSAVAGRVTPDLGADIAKIDIAKTDIAKTDSAPAAALADHRVKALLAKPLTASSSVQVALLANRGLQADYNQLGISEADYVQASLPQAPSLALSRLSGGGEVEIEARLVGSLLALLTLPTRAAIAADQFRAAELRAAEATLRLAADTRRQFYRAVSAKERVSLLNQIQVSANASSELARRLGETGALNRIDQAREHALTGEISAQLAKARLEERVERERLTRLLGLWGGNINFALPASVPPLPSRLTTTAQVEAEALRQRVDLEIARLELAALAKSLGLTQATHLVSDLELTGISATTSGAGMVSRTGLEAAFQNPLFDFGQTRVREAEQRYLQGANRLAERAVNVRSQAREAYQVYRGRYDIAQLYARQILPVRTIIEEESLLHYNGMLTDIPRLVQDARAKILSNIEAIEARRDFWIADTDLHAAISGGRSSGQTAANGAIDIGGEAGGGH